MVKLGGPNRKWRTDQVPPRSSRIRCCMCSGCISSNETRRLRASAVSNPRYSNRMITPRWLAGKNCHAFTHMMLDHLQRGLPSHEGGLYGEAGRLNGLAHRMRTWILVRDT